MNYIVVTSQNGKSYFLAKPRIGGGYFTIATFQNEGVAKETAELLNMSAALDREVKFPVRKVVKGGRK